MLIPLRGLKFFLAPLVSSRKKCAPLKIPTPPGRKFWKLPKQDIVICKAELKKISSYIFRHISECIETSAIAHDHSVTSIESGCFGECLLTHETTSEKSIHLQPCLEFRNTQLQKMIEHYLTQQLF